MKDGIKDGVKDGDEEDRCLGPPHEMLNLSLYSRCWEENAKGDWLKGNGAE